MNSIWYISYLYAWHSATLTVLYNVGLWMMKTREAKQQQTTVTYSCDRELL